MNTPYFPKARTGGLVTQDFEKELLVYDLQTDRAHCLNETAAAVLRACDGTKSVNEIAAAVGRSLKQKVNEDLVLLALDRLGDNDLLENRQERQFKGISRREVIRRIGFASMAALPVIASMAAPESVFAASSCTCQGQLSCVSQPGCPTYCNQRIGLCDTAP